MKKSTLRAQHKWVGLLLAFFMINFAWSGIVLNHREIFGRCSVSRRWMPRSYRLDRWSGGLLRGTYGEGDTVLVYGEGGIRLSDRAGHRMSDFSLGLPPEGEGRAVRALARSAEGTLYAVSPRGLYRLGSGDRWQEVPLEREAGERLEDLMVRGDSTIVVGRSALYLSRGGGPFVPLYLPAAQHFTPTTSVVLTLFRVHSGAVLGLAGKLLVDLAALVLLFLSLSGIVGVVLGSVKSLRRRSRRSLKRTASSHRKMGFLALPLLLFVVLTGWLLRPPLMIPFACLRTEDRLDRPWQDRLRALRYDDTAGEWLLCSSYGFFHTRDLHTPATKATNAPPVSVMGLTVWDRDREGRWVVGSFSGAYSWDYAADSVAVYGTGEAVKRGGMPIFGDAVSGYSKDFDGAPFLVSYDKGTDRPEMPEELRYLPMSLWNYALEVHTGRIYTFLGRGGSFFIFFAGLLGVWVLLTGLLLRKGKGKKQRPDGPER